MENFNKVLSFFLGLVVVGVFLMVITGRINLRSKPSFLKGGIFIKTTPTTTPSSSPFPTTTALKPTLTPSQYQSQPQLKKTTSTKTIPATGLPTITIPFLVSTLAAGFYLKRK